MVTISPLSLNIDFIIALLLFAVADRYANASGIIKS